MKYLLIRVISGLYRGSGKENGNYYSGLYYIGVYIGGIVENPTKKDMENEMETGIIG